VTKNVAITSKQNLFNICFSFELFNRNLIILLCLCVIKTLRYKKYEYVDFNVVKV
jgi:hypothetical protein